MSDSVVKRLAVALLGGPIEPKHGAEMAEVEVQAKRDDLVPYASCICQRHPGADCSVTVHVDHWPVCDRPRPLVR